MCGWIVICFGIGQHGWWVQGAAAFENFGGPNYWNAFPGNGVVVDATSTLGYASDAAIAGGPGSSLFGPGYALGAAPGATVYALPQRLPAVSLTPASISVGTTLTVTLSGQPGLDHVRAVALQTAPGDGAE